MKELVYHRQLLPAVERHADRLGFHDGDYHGTFAQHGDRVLRLADSIGRQLGVARADRFAVLAVNNHRYLELYHAGFLGAGIVNPLNLRLAPKELAFILNDSGTSVVFTDWLFAPLLEQARPDLDKDITVVRMGEGDFAHDADFEELVAAGEPRVPAEPDEDDPVILMYTGGTTGLPKGVLLSQRAEMLNLYHVAIAIGLGEDRVYLHQTPMFHAASMAAILGIPAGGGASVFVPLFKPDDVIELIEKYQVNQTVMVPTMIAMLLNHPDFKAERVASLKTLTYGASPMPGALLKRLFEVLPDLKISQGYGMTESSSVLTFLTEDDHRTGGDILRSAGRPLAGVVLTIQDADGTILPTGEQGEVCARAGNFMDRYWNREKETAEVFRDGWYHSGDMGYLDKNGYLFLVDRVKDMIVTGGENVYSVEVENAIASHPAVEQVAVIGIPHETWGEQVLAIVVLKAGASATEDEIIDHARGLIAGYKLPKKVEFRTEPIPLSGAMKPLKRDLRAPYWEGRERAVN
ncbi:MAG: fatty-acid--CoA ligase [Acidimicrobiales bacterium]|nr:fatty-acid--CoA ligase [Acidimicrobiales bacterium]